MPDLSIIVVAYNVKDLMERCLEKVFASEGHFQKEVIYVDNGSSDGSAEMVGQRFPEVVIIESPVNLGFIRANNLAYTKATGEHILMLNSDAFVGKNTLQKTLDFMKDHPESGALGCRLIGEDGALQVSARYFYTPWKLFLTRVGFEKTIWKMDDLDCSHEEVRECDWVPGCYLLARKAVIEKTGFFLRSDYFMYNDDIDLCLRIKRSGYKVFFFPEDVIHLGGANSKRIEMVTEKGWQIEKYALESQYIYFRKNYNFFYALSHCLMIVSFDLLRLIKQVLFFRKSEIKSQWEHLCLACSLFMRTRGGTRGSVNSDGTSDPGTRRKPDEQKPDDKKKVMFENLREDLKTYQGDVLAQGFWVMRVYRFGRWRYGIRPEILRPPFSLLYKILFKLVQVFTGIELPCEATVGKNFTIEHFGGINISGYASFGDNCRIRQGVTVGLRNTDHPCAPQIGNNVDIGAGAKLLGPIRIGNNVNIGPNAVVIEDVPDNSSVVPIPARIIPMGSGLNPKNSKTA